MAELDLTRVSFRNMTFEAICDFEIVEGLWLISRQSFLEIHTHTHTQSPPIPVQDLVGLQRSSILYSFIY